MRQHYLKYSVFLSIISIVTTLVINFYISRDYFESSGKDRAFFDIKAVLHYFFQYYVGILGIVAVILILLYKGEINQSTKVYWSGMLAFISIVLVFAEVWRFFVWIGN